MTNQAITTASTNIRAPTTTTPVAPMTTTAATDDGEGKRFYSSFLDDPYNMAMYVVLPSMILVYGGCCFIYCMAKLNRYCKRRARRRAKQRLHAINRGVSAIKGKNNKNAGASVRWADTTSSQSDLAVTDLTEPAFNDFPSPATKASTNRLPPSSTRAPAYRTPTAPPMSSPHEDTPRTTSDRPPWRVVGGPVKTTMVNQRSSAAAGKPAYPRRAEYVNTIQEQMKHLDDQLKTAFRLIEHPKKSKPDVGRRVHENAKPLKRRSESKMHYFVSDQ